MTTKNGERQGKGLALLDRIGAIATLLLPVFLVHFRGIAEALLDLIALGFLARCGITKNWSWARHWFVQFTFCWWLWIIISSIAQKDPGVVGQAFMAIRFPVAAFGLAFWTLTDGATRTWLRRIIVGCVLYFAAQFMLQAITGYNLFDDPRFGDGTLTGPYDKPRATAPFSRLALPVVLWVGAMIGSRARTQWIAVSSYAVATLPAVALLVLAGQRMALATFLLGVIVAAVFIPRLRIQAAIIASAAPVLIASLMVLAPQAFGHLVLKTETQLSHFADSDYGLIYNRAITMAQARPILGFGYDAYRHHCRDGVFQVAGPFSDLPDGGSTRICVQHAHNHWLEALSNGGVPGIFLFAIMVVAWGHALAKPLMQKGVGNISDYAWQTGLFAAFFAQEWPLASSSAFLNMPLGGIAFLILGMGLWRSVSPAPVEKSWSP